MKKCGDCNKDKPILDFPPGAAVCKFPCHRMRENIARACKAAGETDWFNEQKQSVYIYIQAKFQTKRSIPYWKCTGNLQKKVNLRLHYPPIAIRV